MSKFEWTCFLAIYCLVGLVQSDTEADGYSGLVEELFKDLNSQYGRNVKKAYEKMAKFSFEPIDRKYAIGIINLYTQDGSFFETLNSQMRKNFPNKNTNIWSRSGDLINRGIEILGPTVFKKLYRGCSFSPNPPPVTGKTFEFNQITSTSLSLETAKKFAACPDRIVFFITNVYGVNIQRYSDFEIEKEVIVKSTYTFKVTKGPIKDDPYTLFYLDGQSELYSNSGYIQRAGILLQCLIVAATILEFWK